MSRIIDADMFLSALIYHGSIDNEKCGWIADTIEKCKVEVFTKDEVIAILGEIQAQIDDRWEDTWNHDYRGGYKDACIEINEIIQHKINALKGRGIKE